jgi:pimeloyl-ACP methyl ester carboxylesterase
MIWISSACRVGTRVAARLTDRTGVLLAAPRERIGEARAAVAAVLGHDPGDSLDVRPDDLAPGRIGEIWHLSYATGEEDEDEAPAGIARETGAAYRRFDLDPVAEAPGEVVPGAFSTLMQALDATVQEVRSRDPGYFDQRALRTTLPADFAFLDAGSAAAEVISAASGPPGRCRISAASADPSLLSNAIGEAYELELIMGSEPSALAAVDRLFESRLGNMATAGSAEPVRRASAAGSSEVTSLVSAWRGHHAASSRAERARLGDFSADPIPHSPGGAGPAFQVFGRSGPQIVIVNAIAQDHKYWVRLIDRLARDHRVVTWAQRSFGEDGQPATLDDHLRDLEAVVSAVAEGPVHLLGWCTGPKLCTRYYLANSRRVASLVFLAGTYRPFGDTSLDTNYEAALDMVFKLLDRSPNIAPIVRTTLLAAMGGGPSKAAQATDLGAEVLARIDPALIPSVAAPYATDESTLQYAKQIRDFWGYSIEPDVGAIQAPVFVIGAELDRIASSRLGWRVAQAMPNASYVELPGATHYCMYDRPDDVASMIKRFVGERDSRATNFCFAGTRQ